MRKLLRRFTNCLTCSWRRFEYHWLKNDRSIAFAIMWSAEVMHAMGMTQSMALHVSMQWQYPARSQIFVIKWLRWKGWDV